MILEDRSARDLPHGSANATARIDALVLSAFAECPEWFASKVAARFVADPSSGCLIWTGTTNGMGYGSVGIPTSVGRQPSGLAAKANTHRTSFLHANGAIGFGLVVDHLCRRPACAQPDHLRAVTVGENTRAGIGFAALQLDRNHCPRGHQLVGANLRGWDLAHGKRACRACVTALSRANNLRRRKHIELSDAEIQSYSDLKFAEYVTDVAS